MKPDSLLVQDDSGRRITIPANTDEQIMEDRGWTVIEDDLAVSRPPKRRTKAQMKQLIKDGIVADPDHPTPDVTYDDDVQVFSVPVASIDVASKE